MTADELKKEHDPENYSEFSNENYLDMYAYAKELEEMLTKQKLNLSCIVSKRPIIIELLKEFYTNNRISPEETADKILAACDSEKGGEKGELRKGSYMCYHLSYSQSLMCNNYLKS